MLLADVMTFVVFGDAFLCCWSAILLTPNKVACGVFSPVFNSWILWRVESFWAEEVAVLEAPRPFRDPNCCGWTIPIPPGPIDDVPGRFIVVWGKLLNEDEPAVIDPPAFMGWGAVGGWSAPLAFIIFMRVKSCWLFNICCCWAFGWAKGSPKFGGGISRGCCCVWLILIFGVIAVRCLLGRGVEELGAGVELFEAALLVVSEIDQIPEGQKYLHFN